MIKSLVIAASFLPFGMMAPAFAESHSSPADVGTLADSELSVKIEHTTCGSAAFSDIRSMISQPRAEMKVTFVCGEDDHQEYELSAPSCEAAATIFMPFLQTLQDGGPTAAEVSLGC